MKIKGFIWLRSEILASLLLGCAAFAPPTVAQVLSPPVPTISLPLVPSGVAPGSVPSTSAGLSITVNGTGFVSSAVSGSSVVLWNGSARPTTFISSTRLTATITAEDVESPGTAWVTVLNGKFSSSNVAYFEITNPTTSVSFSRADYPVGSGPNQGAVSDFNRDGKLDLVVVNTLDNTVSVLLGNGDGTFPAAASYPVGRSPRWVTVGDFNGDGNLDLAVANHDDNTVSILLGDGNGTFQAALNFSAGGSPRRVTSSDFNGDGKLDLAVTNLEANTVCILLGNGDGTFQAPVSYSAGVAPFSLAVGDFNRDGKPDLAVTNQGSGTVSVLLGNGDGTFSAAANYNVGGSPFSVAVGDFNGDGKPDLVVANGSTNNVSVLLGNGDGTFQLAANYGTGTSPQSVAVADLNGDGKLDLAVANLSSNSANLMLGNGDGTFQPAVNYGVGSGANSVAVGDFNADGRMDLAVSNQYSNNVSILLQPTPTGGFAQLNGGNTFTGNQTINGVVTATSFVGDGSGLTGVNASTANTANNANFAANAGSLGGLPPSVFARLDIGNNFNGNQAVAGNLNVSGNSATSGTVTIGGGTAIVKHLSMTFSSPLPVNNCATFGFPGASDGNTVALGVPNAREAGGVILYFAWVSSAGTIKICSFTVIPPPKGTVLSGAIRVDLWQH